MRRINVETITQNIKEMCIEANHFLSPDMKKVFDEAAASEESPLGRQILGQLEENLCIAGFSMNTRLMFSLPNPFGATVISTCSPSTIS